VYRWWVFLHVAGAFGFLLSHGTAVAVMFRLRKERDRAKISALSSLSASTVGPMYISLGVILAAGVIAGFQGRWWGEGWIWTALATLVVVGALMFPLGTLYYRKVRSAELLDEFGEPDISDEELDVLLLSGRPWLLAVLGFGSLLVILWLMMFKPF
jgi:uncharacterized membrane protein